MEHLSDISLLNLYIWNVSQWHIPFLNLNLVAPLLPSETSITHLVSELCTSSSLQYVSVVSWSLLQAYIPRKMFRYFRFYDTKVRVSVISYSMLFDVKHLWNILHWIHLSFLLLVTFFGRKNKSFPYHSFKVVFVKMSSFLWKVVSYLSLFHLSVYTSISLNVISYGKSCVKTNFNLICFPNIFSFSLLYFDKYFL